MIQKVTIVFFLFLIPLVVFGQTGKIKGRVTETGTDEPLIGANVIVLGTSLGAATDFNGEYTITNVEAGVYEVKASYVGFQSKTISNLRVNAGLTLEVDFDLVGEGFTVEEISVVAERPLVNKFATNANRISTSEDIEALPVRGLNEILAITPGVTFQDETVFVRGGRQDEVGFYLEGASITDPVVGGRAVTIVQDAVEEIQVQSGGYTAEYGGANSGIIYTQLKTGTQQWKASFEYITDNITFKGNDKRYDGEKRLGTHWFGYSNSIGTISGPLFDDRIKLFLLGNYNYEADRNPQPYPGINLGLIGDPTTGDTINFTYPAGALRNNSLETITGSGTLTLDFNPFIFRLVGTYTKSQDEYPWFGRVGGNIASFLNSERIATRDFTDGAFSFKGTHILSSTTFYEISAGYSFNNFDVYDPILEDNWLGYGDSIANSNAGVVWSRSEDDNTGRFQRPARLNIFSFSFNGPGDVMANYQKSRREKLNIAGALSIELGKEHSIKAGGELQMFTIRNYGWTNEAVMAIAGLLHANRLLSDNDPLKQTDEEVIIGRGVNNYGYDLFGNSYDGSDDFAAGKVAPKQPILFGAYIQDKIEWNDLIVNIGLRYDYIDIDNQKMIDPTRPELSISKSSKQLIPEGWEDVPTFDAISPRLGISFAVTDQTVFHAQYGKFVQQTRLRDAYTGPFATAVNLAGGFEITAPVGFNIRPTRTTQYEVGFTQQVGDFGSFDITGYYKDIQDQVVFNKITVANDSEFQDYNVLENGDFATTKGLEISFNMRRVERFQANGSISFQDARGTGSFPNSNRGIVGAPLDGVTIFAPQYVSPLEFNNTFSGSINLDYRFGVNDGPSWLERFGVSALATFTSGHPYTTGIGGADLEGDARDRQPVEPLNSSTTPATLQVDLRIDKTFNVSDLFDINVYVHVINLFDALNIENVFLRTGSVDDDGYLSDPSTGGQLVETFGPEYEALYKALNIDYYQQWQYATTGAPYTTTPYFYGPPRQIRFGIRLEY
jgi:hypothetical protein